MGHVFKEIFKLIYLTVHQTPYKVTFAFNMTEQSKGKCK